MVNYCKRRLSPCLRKSRKVAKLVWVGANDVGVGRKRGGLVVGSSMVAVVSFTKSLITIML